MKIYTENFTILLNKHITNKEIDTYEFRVRKIGEKSNFSLD